MGGVRSVSLISWPERQAEVAEFDEVVWHRHNGVGRGAALLSGCGGAEVAGDWCARQLFAGVWVCFLVGLGRRRGGGGLLVQ